MQFFRIEQFFFFRNFSKTKFKMSHARMKKKILNDIKNVVK